MNTQHTNLLKVASKTETAVINNTADQTTVNNLKTVFTSANLWNIHRHGRTMFDRRRCA
ncbi:hypothetical protein ACQ33O_04110 [Ferruginibacter sp. SUN002]|uniref:hypothetical protein n=1 Tax=Ferruginibacter sp. SUN002 TaxID=2937789 RepID=UPI003D367342